MGPISLTPPVGLAIGSHRWNVSSDSPRYVAMLAERYRLTPSQPHDFPDVVANIARRLRDSPARTTDQLIVRSTAHGYRLITDPITIELESRDGGYRADVAVTDDSMSDELIGFHLWLLVNRMMLIMNRMLLHAAAVEIDGQTVVICGDSGAGKSTLTVALGLQGGTVLAEDWLLVNCSLPSTTISGVSSVMRLCVDSAERLLPGRLEHAVASTDGKEKRVFDSASLFASAPALEFAPHRIFVLSAGEHDLIEPASPLELTRHLTAAAKWTLRFAERDDYASFLGLAAGFATSVPVYRLRRSTDFRNLPTLVELVRSCRESP